MKTWLEVSIANEFQYLRYDHDYTRENLRNS